MRILFATWPNVAYQAEALTDMGANNRLVSYFFSRDMKHSSFKQYAKTGLGIYPEGKKKVDPKKLFKEAPLEPPPVADDDEEEF